jgi:trans-aconitate 2-methyltransferase
MASWNSTEYLQFARERTQPASDLVARIELEAPARIVDLGCGPGNSTAVLARRWPQAEITGIDSSASMLETARREYPQWTWHEGDIGAWRGDERGPVDLVFSNAALQWVPHHGNLLPRLYEQVAPGGALAFQIPANLDSPPQRMIREIAAQPSWENRFVTPPKTWSSHPLEFYYDLFAALAKRIELWTTDYAHVMESVDGIVDWYRGTGLRPWLDALPDDAARDKFILAYRTRLSPYYPLRSDGRVLFPFRRLFVIAYR